MKNTGDFLNECELHKCLRNAIVNWRLKPKMLVHKDKLSYICICIHKYVCILYYAITYVFKMNISLINISCTWSHR